MILSVLYARIICSILNLIPIVRMRELRLLGIVLGIVFLLLILSRFLKREGFTDADDMHNKFADTYHKKFNEVGTSLASTGLAPPLTNNVGALGADTQGIFGNVIDEVDNNGHSKEVINNPYPVQDGETGLMKLIKKCEVVNTTDCNAFDNPEFSTNCGMCLDIGKNSQGKPATGGLLLLPAQKKDAQNNTVGNFLPLYTPNLGFCPARRMVATKAECIKVKKEIQCERNTTFDSPTGCSQCYTDTSYSIVNRTDNPGLFNGTGTIYVVGSGTLTYSEAGQSNSGKHKLSDRPYPITLQGPELNNLNLTFKAPPVPVPYNALTVYEVEDLIIFNGKIFSMAEGAGQPGYNPDRQDDKLWQYVAPASEYVPAPPPFMAGYLSGATANGDFSIDLYRLILNDARTGRKPRTAGEIEIDGVRVSKLAPGHGFKTMVMVARSPFTFVDPTSEEASLCPASPFITQQASSEFLGSDPCYKKDSGPGKYNVECLQTIFLANGCTEKGSAYPKKSTDSQTLLYDKDGKARSIDDIANTVYSFAVLTASGVDTAGTKASLQDWSKASVFCTGVSIESPCDTTTKNTGPLSPDCIVYLWNNQGENKRIGTTYTATSMANSLFDKGNKPRRFCTSSGILSPVNSDGTTKLTNTSYWQGFGGVKQVSNAMKTLHQNANNNALGDAAKELAIQQCYGVKLDSRPSFTTKYVSDKTDYTTAVPSSSQTSRDGPGWSI